MKFCRDCSHFNDQTDHCQHPDYSPVTDIVTGSRSYVPAIVSRHINVLCGKYALNWRARDIPTVSSQDEIWGGE